MRLLGCRRRCCLGRCRFCGRLSRNRVRPGGIEGGLDRAGDEVRIEAAAILGVSVLTWFVPMIWLTGGFQPYLAASVELAESVVKPTSIVGGPLETTLQQFNVWLLEKYRAAMVG